MSGSRSHPGIHFPPPLLFVLGLAAGAWLNGRWPVPVLPGALRGLGVGAGWLLVASASVLLGACLITFLRARTSVMPNRAASRVVTHGPYRFTRNPMYVALTLLHLGVSLLIDSLWALLFVFPALAVLQSWIVPREERHLASAFGAEYEAYRRRVNRWLP